MVDVEGTLAYAAVYLIGFIIAPYLHEGSHWAVGKLGDTGPEVDWRIARGLVPQAVRHKRIETIDGAIIRLSGLSIFLWLPPWILSLGILAVEINPLTVLIVLLPFLVVFGMATESDVLAVRSPEKYRERSIDDELPADPVFSVKVVFGVLLVSMVYVMLLH
ncbi:hypothetical protein [Halomicrobium urmianum]|uniref:hypothetical protein n=1 Tax=Halomicrobium urmianum TaxID=1586233 RepID=UPI001CD97B79|nr:hypothetical protein [Halomicrobium urmianum]